MVRLLLAALLLLPGPARADDLTVGFSAAITSLDPHFHTLGSNNAINRHVFDRLIHADEALRLQPGLAVAWRATGPLEWEVSLRPNVRFHDGTPFTAADVAASLRRAPSVPGSPGSFGVYLSAVAGVTVVDPLTIRIATRQPAPSLPNDLTQIAVISAARAEASTADYNAGPAAIGTGPFRFTGYAPGDRVTFRRNPDHWGGAAAWDVVTFRFIPNPTALVAALLAGDVQLIDGVSPVHFERLRRAPGVALFTGPTPRVIYLGMDQARDASPGVADAQGRPVERNPLRDRRVREALSLALNRAQIVERVMDGAATAAGQISPPGYFGASDRLGPAPHDPARARALLAEAGWPDGFRLTLLGPNDRYVNDERVMQAVAQMFGRIGIATTLEAVPFSVAATRIARREASLWMGGWGGSSGEMSANLRALVATVDPASGMGAQNRGLYSSLQVDALLAEALRTFDDTRRAALLAEATEAAIADHALIPLHFESYTWATRGGIVYVPRFDQLTLAMSARRP
ncbi:ABC transporter substrate-binding protein [Falsiroseomonas sp. HW251]|uniref:ABC transporter substrate-binding protein n=1 Tax=Falsiroseomonas sp. HW251 TaxID=3390998 RepID=UPI003D3205B8